MKIRGLSAFRNFWTYFATGPLWNTLSNSCPEALKDACNTHIQAQPEDQRKLTKTQWNAALKPLGLSI